jgi:hypothetical protein
MVYPTFIPQSLVGRIQERHELSQILAQDGDVLIAGVPGSGRRRLICEASEQVGARILEIDCLQTTNSSQFLRLLANAITIAFSTTAELAKIQAWTADHPITLEHLFPQRSRLVWHLSPSKEWGIFQALLNLPQSLAEWFDCRVVLVFQNFPHIRSWDRTGKWEAHLRQEIQLQSRVSYALVSTVVEPWVYASKLQVITLAPLSDDDLKPWITQAMQSEGLQFDEESQALTLFLSYVQGHLGAAIALARRIWVEIHATVSPTTTAMGDRPASIIYSHQVHRSALGLIEDLSVTFESLILLLPSSQVRVLESLALDPTDSPHSRSYIKKHQLSRGGGLQGALNSLEQKGLVYGPQYGYRIAMPFLSIWLEKRIRA